MSASIATGKILRMLNIQPFEKTIDRLTEGLARYHRDTEDAQIRDGLIQRFEFTYELAWKTLKRYLEQAAANPAEIDAMPFADLIRTANEQGLLRSEWPKWRTYREMRNKTSHAYDEGIALEVVEGIPDFIDEAVHLRNQLRRRLE
ncbi:nucleotidyltransferase substrate binding protein [Methylohalobius crimeensis]|uniref:nucleotidyltransferase substrate binding protein n=1 Tax=Methylohalobius crimeensis TaxID=244365 RepID=UPI00190F4009|nr:nucleotidyltransferase substrate binding protein [Methylohalobius crimeensis]